MSPEDVLAETSAGLQSSLTVVLNWMLHSAKNELLKQS